MKYDRFLIAPMKSGLITDIKAWQIPEDAFARLNNAYIHEGILRKRFGSLLMGGTNVASTLDQLASRLRIEIGTTNGSGALSGTAPGSIFAVGQMFSIDTEIFTVVALGTPGTMKTTGSATTCTFNTTSGAYVFDGAAATKKVYYYPSLPVMGITQLEENKSETNPTFAFDRQFIYKYTGGFWARNGTVVLKGSDHNFIWATNWTGITNDQIAMFITNFNATVGTPSLTDDPMYVYKGGSWSEFGPVFNVQANVVEGYVKSARLIIPFKNRLLLLNTIEYKVSTNTNSEHVNRCRFSHNGTPFPADSGSNLEASVSSAWLEPNLTWNVGATTKISDGAGWVDAPVEEEITSAEFLKDRLIVYFERSTWEIAYTGNEVQPFVWQKINTELGTKSLNSAVPFDKAVFNIGLNGVHGCTGINVSKINEKIESFTYDIRKSNYGFERISGIRDYVLEHVYWSYPSVSANKYSQTFPNKILYYCYKNDSWATADDCITVFGYFEQQTGVSWESTELSWEKCNFSWDLGSIQSQYRQIIAGNQHGFTFICDPNISANEAVMQITNITDAGSGIASITIINHTLDDDDFIKLVDIGSIGIDTSINYKVSVVDANTVTIGSQISSTYKGGGRAARVSRIDILSKQWNFYIDKGSNFFLAKIDFAVLRTSYGEITVDYYPSATDLSMIESASQTGSILGNNKLQTSPFSMYPLEDSQTRLWHPVYFQTEGECVQIRIYLDDEQMEDQFIADSDFQLEGLVAHARKTSERLQ